MSDTLYLPASKINNPRIISSTSINKAKRDLYERKQKILHVILKFLQEHKLNATAEALQNETQMGDCHRVCDNVDLDIMLQEYESYYFMKFKKYPQILKNNGCDSASPKQKNWDSDKNKKAGSAKAPKPKLVESGQQKFDNENVTKKEDNNFQFEIIPLINQQHGENLNKTKMIGEPSFTNDLKLPSAGGEDFINFENSSAEWREMADQILQQFVPKTLNVTWKDCIGLYETVERLKEAALYPVLHPELFKNVCSWRGILLYGPPGTGKTLLARALACESPSNFINVASSTFVSKWRGESEKMLKVLFDVAKLYAPCTIFIDEIDALISQHSEANHEASRRFKSEFLTQIDGILQQTDNTVFVLATTNSPWLLDRALLRRFEKRIFVPLPDESTRRDIFSKYLEKLDNVLLTYSDLCDIAKNTRNFSGSDIRTICKEVEMMLIRDKICNLNNTGPGSKKENALRKITLHGVMAAKEKVTPCIEPEYYRKYLDWNDKFGAV